MEVMLNDNSSKYNNFQKVNDANQFNNKIKQLFLLKKGSSEMYKAIY